MYFYRHEKNKCKNGWTAKTDILKKYELKLNKKLIIIIKLCIDL